MNVVKIIFAFINLRKTFIPFFKFQSQKSHIELINLLALSSAKVRNY